MEKKRMKLVEWAMNYSSIVILVTCFLMAFGIYALSDINKNEFPDFTIRQGVVIAVYPGATVDEVEQQVTKPLEDYIFTYKEVKRAKTVSYSRSGAAIVQVELKDNVTDKDEFWSKFKHGVSLFKSSLPSGVAAVVVQDDFGDSSALLITIESEDKTYRELYGYLQDLQDSLRLVESVGRMTLHGMQNEEIEVRLDKYRISRAGLDEKVIMSKLLGSGFVTSAGTLKGEDYESPIVLSRPLNIEKEVEDIVVYASPDGSNVLRLKDISSVCRKYPKPSSYVTNNGRKCIVLSVEMAKGQSITDLGKEVDAKLSGFRSSLPDGVNIFKITDQAKVVRDSVNNFLRELLIAVAAVIVVVMLLMPFKVAVIAASTIPVTIFISLGLFYVLGIELNSVSLAALIVTLGMIVDNSIVIIDSYMEKLSEGIDRRTAAIESASHFFRAIFSATLAISVTFFPFLVVMTGVMKDFLASFPWAISIVLVVSLLVAALLVPFMQYYIIRRPAASGTSGKFSMMVLLQKVYDRLIRLCFNHPVPTLTVGFIAVISGIFLLLGRPMRLLPAAERNQFAVEISLPTGTSLERTAELADSLENILKKDSRIVSVASFKGAASPRFQNTYAPQFASINYAQFIVNTVSEKATEEVLSEYRPKYQEAFPEAYVKFKQLSYGTEANPVEVRLSGDDWEILKQVSDTVLKEMRMMPELYLVRTSLNEPQVSAEITLDQNRANMMGVSNTSVELSMMQRYGDGFKMASLWEGDYEIPVKIKGPDSDSADRTMLENEMISIYGGAAKVPLWQLAEVSPVWKDGQICHRNGTRTITVFSEVDQNLNVTKVTGAVKKRLEKISIPEGVSLTYGGEDESNAEILPEVVMALIIAVVIIFFILLSHYKHIKISLLILTSLSLCVFGASVGVWVQGVDFSLTCFLGLISLMGIMVRNAIIMFDFAEELQNEGMPVKQAIFTSAKRRMRPIFLTSAAASMGVIPMITGGSNLWMPMGAVVCYGTLITMIFIMTVLPVAYWLVMRKPGGEMSRKQIQEQ